MVDQKPLTPRQQELVTRAVDYWRPAVQGRVVVITGGARGIGQAMGERLLQAGARLAAADKTWVGADAWRGRLETAGGLALEFDVTNDAGLDSAYDAVMSSFGTVDFLVNNAALVSETLFPPTGRVKTLDVCSTDYPHGDSRYPHATDSLLELPLSDDAKRKILWDNCARFYGLDDIPQPRLHIVQTAAGH